jgi:pre-mRNA-splicing factor ATP-dependent RNA helicase DHX15/PRP43
MNNNIGILDIKGENSNPLNNNPYSEEYKKLAQVWSKFPAYEKAQEILNEIKNNQVVLIISGTGSGKTVLLPKFALHVFDYNKKIAVTLPKQIIAKSAAEFAAKTLDVKLGEEVGFQYKGESSKSDKTKLLYATDGTIVSRLLKDPLLKEFDCVIIDEAHERKVQIDFLLYLLKNVVKSRPDFKLIIMSATVNEDIFKAYFAEEKFITLNVGAKTNYPIESIFLKEPINSKEFLEKGYEIMKEIIKKDDLNKEGSHDILFFITSVSEANKICEKIGQDQDIMKDNMCIEVYAGMDPVKQELAQDKNMYKEKFNKKRKIVLATNVAESSLTIDGIKYVIDSGLELSGYFDPEFNSKVLDRKMITHAQAKQRMGRAGRTESGYCYHLYTQEDFDKNMERFPEPTIRVSNITSEALKFLAIPEIGTFTSLLDIFSKFIEPPREKYIRYTYNELISMGLLRDDKITQLGLIVNDIGLDPKFALSCIVGKKLRCLNEILAVCSCLEAGKNNINEFFRFPSEIIKIDEFSSDEEKEAKKGQIKSLNKKFKKSLSKFNTKYGDITSLLKIFVEVYTRYDKDGHRFGDKTSDLCYKYFLNPTAWIKACSYYDKYMRTVRNVLRSIEEIKELIDLDMAVKVNTCFYYSFKNNYVELYDNKYYKNSKINVKNINLNEDSFNYDDKLPKELFYIELIKNFGKYEIGITSKISDSTKKIYNIVSKNI